MAKFKDLKPRALSAIVMLGVFIGCMVGGYPYFPSLLAGVLVLSLVEWSDLITQKKGRHIAIGTSIIGVVMLFQYYLETPIDALNSLIVIAGINLASEFTILKNFNKLFKGVLTAGFLLICVCFVFILQIYEEFTLPNLDYKWAAMLYLFVNVWIVDTAAFFCGSIIGGPKVAPKISPKKTWAGVIGAIVFTTLFNAIMSYLYFPELMVQMVVFGLTVPILAQIGDFAESHVKRTVGVKDTSNLIPGHGGVLDRIDGLLLATPYFFFYYHLVIVS